MLESRIQFRYFFDRKNVVDAVGKMKVKALKKGGFAVMQATRRSITKQGMSKPKLKVEGKYPDMKLGELVNNPRITERERKSVVKRLREVQFPEHSRPGQPPFTHTGMFRNHILFHWDPVAESVVVGQAMPQGDWLARLHEFGGSQKVQAWVYVPQRPGRYSPIIRFKRAGAKMQNTSKWQPTRIGEFRRYPPRPYMRPALEAKVRDGTIVNQFRLGGM